MPLFMQIACYLVSVVMIMHYWCVANFLPKYTPTWLSMPIIMIFGSAMMLLVSAFQNDLLFTILSLTVYAASSLWIQVMLWLYGLRINQVARNISKDRINWDAVIKDLRGQANRVRSTCRVT